MSEVREDEKGSISIDPAELEGFLSDLFVAAGVDALDAAAVAEHLVLAERRGHQSHGTVRVRQYMEALRAGDVMPRTEIKVVKNGPSVALLDGGHGWGMTIGKAAMGLAIAKAKETGIALVAAGRCQHLGMLGYYTGLAANEGMIGMCFACGPRSYACAAPWGGKEARLSTNPLSIAIPGSSGCDVILDMATTQVALGKIRLAFAEGRQVPADWALDKNGNPTTDPVAAMSGLSLPLGGAKGYALSVMVDLLCGLLSADEKYPEPGDFDTVFLAIDLAFFQPLVSAKEKVDLFARLMKSATRLPGVDEIMLPGEPEARASEATRDAVIIGAKTWQDLVERAERLGVASPTTVETA